MAPASQSRAALAGELLGLLPRLPVAEGDARAGFGKEPDRLRANAARAAGDESCLTVQREGKTRHRATLMHCRKDVEESVGAQNECILPAVPLPKHRGRNDGIAVRKCEQVFVAGDEVIDV